MPVDHSQAKLWENMVDLHLLEPEDPPLDLPKEVSYQCPNLLGHWVQVIHFMILQVDPQEFLLLKKLSHLPQVQLWQ